MVGMSAHASLSPNKELEWLQVHLHPDEKCQAIWLSSVLWVCLRLSGMSRGMLLAACSGAQGRRWHHLFMYS